MASIQLLSRYFGLNPRGGTTNRWTFPCPKKITAWLIFTVMWKHKWRVDSSLLCFSGTMRAARWVPWWKPLFPKPAPSRGRAERDASNPASASGSTQSSGMEVIGHFVEMGTENESFPVIRCSLKKKTKCVSGRVLICSALVWPSGLTPSWITPSQRYYGSRWRSSAFISWYKTKLRRTDT